MIRGTTPTIIYHVSSNLDFSKITEAEITVAQENKKKPIMYSKYMSDGDVILNADARSITTKLSQEETLEFLDGTVEIQLRLLLDNEVSMATKVKVVSIEKLLEGGVISADS